MVKGVRGVQRVRSLFWCVTFVPQNNSSVKVSTSGIQRNLYGVNKHTQRKNKAQKYLGSLQGALGVGEAGY